MAASGQILPKYYPAEPIIALRTIGIVE